MRCCPPPPVSLVTVRGKAPRSASSLLSVSRPPLRGSIGVLKPAGQVTPSEKPFHPDGKPLATVAPENWSEVETATVATIKRISIALLGYAVEVIIADDFGWSFDGAYENGKLYINKPRLGNKFFAAALCESALSFLIHEFAHEHAGDHLSHEYHEAACRLGARIVV